MSKAEFVPRFFAWLFDSIAMSIVSISLGFLFWALMAVANNTQSGLLEFLTGSGALLTGLLLVLLQFLYFGFFWSKSGRSIGMKLFDMRVVRRDGEPLSFVRAGLRGSVGYWISGLVFGLGYIWAAFDGNREAWHDKIFDTWVVQVEG
ncbi:MAG: RDD family protein [Chloroflexota bacterium]|nr:RDD family protein [Chloroflexota bacterium]